jgi:D-beta-D-heptose 7-phosphate kinase/D-beta-D-heptose 1-phosphate adenosyltransferase
MSDQDRPQLLDLAGAKRVVADCRARGLRLVFTNGVFDLIHAGHVSYLTDARALGDFLLVGLNSDTSVRVLKGLERPIVFEEDRAAVLLGLRAVDAVVIFDEPTASEIILDLRPAIYAKGGDYTLAGTGSGTPLPEEASVRSYGGEIRLIPYLPQRSTTDLLRRIRATGS